MPLKIKMQSASSHATRWIASRYAEPLRMYPVVEYPKCGGTWLCRMIAHALQLPFAQYSLLPVAMPCVTHAHWGYAPKMKNVTYLTRDGRDAVVSFYHHLVRPSHHPYRKDGGRNSRTLDSIIGADADKDDIRANLPTFIRAMHERPIWSPYNWADHAGAWWGKPGVTCVRYEDLRADCVAELTRIVRSLGAEMNEGRIERAVHEFSMETMTGRKPGEEDASSFIRKGVVGDWRRHFTPEAARLFHELAGDSLIRLGYEEDEKWVEAYDSSSSSRHVRTDGDASNPSEYDGGRLGTENTSA